MKFSPSGHRGSGNCATACSGRRERPTVDVGLRPRVRRGVLGPRDEDLSRPTSMSTSGARARPRELLVVRRGHGCSEKWRRGGMEEI